MNTFKRALYSVALVFYGLLHPLHQQSSAEQVKSREISLEELKLMENVDHLIKKLPDTFEFYKYAVYKNTSKQELMDACLYNWSLIGQDYQKNVLTRADIYLFRDDESPACRFFPYYSHEQDSPRELFTYQAVLMATFKDREFVRLIDKCQPEFHNEKFFGHFNALPRTRSHAYIDDCLDHGVPFAIWNPEYTSEDADTYAEFSNYITTKFLVSSDRLLNAIMYTFSGIFSVGTSSILYDKELTDRVFEIDARAMTLSMTIIYNIVLPLNIHTLSKESLAKLDALAFSVIRRFSHLDSEAVPPVTVIPARIIIKLMLSNYYSFEDVFKMSQDPGFLKIGYPIEISKYLGDYFRKHEAYKKAIEFYRIHQAYQIKNQDFYFKDQVETGICLSYMELGDLPKNCNATIKAYVGKLTSKIDENKTAQVSNASIHDLAKLTVLQQDTINLNAKIRDYLYILIALSIAMAAMILFLIYVQKALRRKNRLIKDQRNSLERTNIKIEEQRHSIQQILDETADIILKFDDAGQILPYSSKAAKMLFSDLDGVNIFDWVRKNIRLSDDRLAQIQEVLKAVLNEPVLSWELNFDHLPKEAILGEHSYSLVWTPIFQDGATHEILITAHNLSHIREVEELRAEQDLILTIVQSGPQPLRWIHALPDRLAHIKTLVPGPLLSRHLHTIKGEARTHHLVPVVDACHQLEQILIDKGPFQFAIEHLEAVAKRVLNTLRTLEFMHTQPAKDESILDIFEGLKKEAKVAMAAEGFDLRFCLIFAADFNEVRTTKLVGEILLHAVNNSLDHGFVRHKQRFPNPNQAIHIEVRIEGDDGRPRLEIGDNGVGLDEVRLKQKAKDLGWHPAAGRSWTDIVFEAGVSTASDDASQRSGRGAGLSAVWQAAQELGIRPRLEQRLDGKIGTRLIVE